MCGILGILTKDETNIKILLLNNLKKLEYRGYDSSGLTILKDNKLITYKSVGEIKNLENSILNLKTICHLGIAHTRWATHGKVSTENTHPHLSFKQNWSCVHNEL